jgi:tRNA(Arg) A34 adenosine deaminase TadA
MNKKIFGFLEMAAQVASKDKEGRRRYWIGAVGIRGDGTMVSATNGSADRPNRTIHAEYRLANKLDYDAVVYVARVRICDGEFSLAKPCASCRKALKSKRVKKVYYTKSPEEYGVLTYDEL